MNKKFTEFFNRYMMTVEKNSAYGVVNGYETSATLQAMDNVNPLRIHISFYATGEQKRNIEQALRNAAIKFFNFEISAYGLLIGLNDMTMGKLIKRLPDIFDTVYGILAENGALGEKYCPVCGEELGDNPVKACKINGFTVTIEEKCVETLNAVIEEEDKDFAAAPNNYLRGFFGALIGGVVGIIIAVLLNLAGFIASLSSVVAVIVGCFLYKKFGGKPNKMMLVIVGLTTFVTMMISVPLIYVVASGIAAEGSGYSAWEAFIIVMGDEEVARMFYADLALTAVFSIVGVVLEIFTQSKLVKRRTKL